MNETKVISSSILHSTEGNKSHICDNRLKSLKKKVLGKKDLSLSSSFTAPCFHLFTDIFNYNFIFEAQAGRDFIFGYSQGQTHSPQYLIR